MPLSSTEAFRDKSDAEVLQMTFESQAKELFAKHKQIAVGFSYPKGGIQHYVYAKCEAGQLGNIGELLDGLRNKSDAFYVGYFVAEIGEISSKPGIHTLKKL